jgi:CheY-like chemotaxis protein
MSTSAQMTDQPLILIVEDDPGTRTYLEMVFSETHRTITAKSAACALKKAENDGFDLFLIDISLGEGLDGCELLIFFRQMPRFAQTPMVAMTAHQLRSDRNFYIERGFDDFIAKPFFPADLLVLVDRLLENKPSAPHRRHL